MLNETVLTLIVTETWINVDVTISSFQPRPVGAYGNVEYSITFVQKKPLKIYSTNELKIAAFVRKTKPRASSSSSGGNYTVVSGDTLWGIASKKLGSGTKWTKIYDTNKDTMVVNAKCNPCKEPTKYVVGFFDGPRGRHGCLFDCKNERCEVYQVKRFTESEAVKERIKIQNLNSQKGMYAGYIAALRKDAKITMMKMSQIAGCSPAEYSSYEHERKEFDPEIYRKCEKYLKKKEGGGRC
mgnify:CR=1 FL=1